MLGGGVPVWGIPELAEHPGAEHITESWHGEVDVGVRVLLTMVGQVVFELCDGVVWPWPLCGGVLSPLREFPDDRANRPVGRSPTDTASFARLATPGCVKPLQSSLYSSAHADHCFS